MATSYQMFVSKHMKDANIRNLPPTEKIKRIAAMWRGEKGGKKMAKKARGKGLFGDIVGTIGSLGHLIPF